MRLRWSPARPPVRSMQWIGNLVLVEPGDLGDRPVGKCSVGEKEDGVGSQRQCLLHGGARVGAAVGIDQWQKGSQLVLRLQVGRARDRAARHGDRFAVVEDHLESLRFAQREHAAPQLDGGARHPIVVDHAARNSRRRRRRTGPERGCRKTRSAARVGSRSSRRPRRCHSGRRANDRRGEERALGLAHLGLRADANVESSRHRRCARIGRDVAFSRRPRTDAGDDPAGFFAGSQRGGSAVFASTCGLAGGWASAWVVGLVLAGQGGHENQNIDPNHGDDSLDGSRWHQESGSLGNAGPMDLRSRNQTTICEPISATALQPSRSIFSLDFDYDGYWLVCRLKRAVLAQRALTLFPPSPLPPTGLSRSPFLFDPERRIGSVCIRPGD